MGRSGRLGRGQNRNYSSDRAHTEFCARVGRLGLLGTVTIVLLFGLFVIKGFQIAGRAGNAFGEHLAMGITMLIGMQALVNAGVVTGPFTHRG